MKAIPEIWQYIPQREPFVMVDSLDECRDDGARSSWTPEPGHLFEENGLIRESALIENMAQTAAARAGYLSRKAGKPVPGGYIGAVQQFRLNRLPRSGEKMVTDIVVRHQVLNATIITGSVSSGDECLATCEMKIFLSE